MLLSSLVRTNAFCARHICKRRSHRLAFLGSDQFSCLILNGLLQARPDLLSSLQVVTQAPSRTGRGLKKLNPTLLHQLAEQRGLTHHLVEQKSDLSERLPAQLEPTDVLVTASFGFLLPDRLIDVVPPLQALNVHPSLLPKYRGAAPVQWAIANGDASTGVTVQTLSRKKFDQGLILQQRLVDLPETATCSAILPALANIGVELLMKVLDDLELSKRQARTQEGPATLAPKISKDQLQVDWTAQTATELDRLHRAWSDHSPLWTVLEGRRVQLSGLKKASDALVVEGGGLNPGEARFDAATKVLQVGCGQGSSISVSALKPEGKKVQSAGDFWNGASRGRKALNLGT